MQIFAVLFNDYNTPDGLTANQEFQALFLDRPSNLLHIFECSPESVDCPVNISDYPVSSVPCMMIMGQAGNRPNEYVPQEFYYGPWDRQAMKQRIQAYAGAPAPNSGNGGVIPSSGDQNDSGDFGSGSGWGWTPDWLYLLIGGLATYKALSSKGGSRLVFGAAGGYFLLRYYNKSRITGTATSRLKNVKQPKLD